MDLQKISKIATDVLIENREKIVYTIAGFAGSAAVFMFEKHRKDSEPYVNITDRDAIRLLCGEKLAFDSEFGTFYLISKKQWKEGR